MISEILKDTTSVNKILIGGIQDDYTLPIIYGRSMKDGFEKSKGFNQDFTLALGHNGNDLKPGDFSPNVRGFIHGDTHKGSLVHNSTRMTQSVLQSGGIVLIGDSFRTSIDLNPKLKPNEMQVTHTKGSAVTINIL